MLRAKGLAGSLEAVVAGCQRSKAKKGLASSLKAKAKKCLQKQKERAAQWRALYRAKGLAESLGSLVPGCQRSQAKRTLGKSLKVAARKKMLQKKKDRAAKATGPLLGQRVRLVGDAVPATLRNSEHTVLKHWPDTGRVEVLAASSLRQYSTADVYVVTGKEVPAFPDKLPDLRRITDLEKKQALELAGGELKFVQTGQELEAPELQACWLEIVARAHLSGSEKSQHLHWIDCTALQPALALPVSDLKPEAGELKELLARLTPLKASKTAELVLCPVHSPGHWTLLSLEKTDSGLWTVDFWDSLVPASAGGHTVASQTLTVLQYCLKPAGPSLTEAPQPRCYVRQTDAWSCGVWVLQTAEMLLRRFRGEGVRARAHSQTDRVALMNRWLSMLKTFQARQKPEKPPLPPPVGPPPVPGQPAPEPLPLSDYAPSGGPAKWGCSRCKYSQTGCDRCNPYKAKAKADKDLRKS